MVKELIKITPEQEKINFGAFVHEFLFTSTIKAVLSRVEALEGRPAIPQKASATTADDGSIKIKFEAVEGAKAYIVHYGAVNDPEPKRAIFMGYTETTEFTLSREDVPVPNMNGDVVYFWVQAFKEVGEGATDEDKIHDLMDGTHWGSEWGGPTVGTVKAPKEPEA